MKRRSFLASLGFSFMALGVVPKTQVAGETQYWTLGVSRLGYDTYLAPDPYISRFFVPVIVR